tara:strand:- start:23224 stop:24114 length:891 start_codon:yes stop_codon:yes gene_type:complete
MKITNKFGLPDTFLNFLRSDKYSKGNADISVTSLIDSPRIKILRDNYSDEIEFDAVDNIWALFGTAVHHVLETSRETKNSVREERLYANVLGWELSGALDDQELLDDGTVSITDYKVTSAWSVIFGKDEWVAQQNCYAWLVEKSKNGKFSGRKVNSLRICAILRDWQKKKAAFDNDYPSAPVVLIDLPLWDFEKRDAFVKERMEMHQDAQQDFDQNNKLIYCSTSDQWAKPDTWAVKRKGQKRAMRVWHSEEDAITHANSNSALKGNCEIEHRQGELTRCANYCSVSKYCDQYNDR